MVHRDFEVFCWIPYLTLPYLTLPYPYLTLPYLTLPYLTSPHLTSPHLTSPHLTSPHLTSPHLTSPHLTLPHLTSPHLTLLWLQWSAVVKVKEDGQWQGSLASHLGLFTEAALKAKLSLSPGDLLLLTAGPDYPAVSTPLTCHLCANLHLLQNTHLHIISLYVVMFKW